jgi:CBS domain-containing protein
VSTAIKDVMTASVITVQRYTPFATVAAELEQHKVSAVPVLDSEGHVLGVVSEADLLVKLAVASGEDREPGMTGGTWHHQEQRKARALTAGDLMTAPPVTVSPDDTVQHAARLMHLHRVKRLPVVDADTRLAGIISRADVLSAFTRADKEISQEVTADIALSTSPADSIDVHVRDGVVTLTGTAQASEIAHTISRRIRYIEGVVAVRDRMSYPPPRPVRFDVLASFPID